MRECLKCKKDISGKHESAKFCSTSCRVMYNRKNGKRNEIKPVQMQVLYNAIMDKLDKMGLQAIISPIPAQKSTFDGFTLPATEKQKTRRSFEYYQQARIDCADIDEWATIKAQIMADEFLTQKQKQLLTLNG